MFRIIQMFQSKPNLIWLLLRIPVVLISLSFHEMSHAYAAYKMGDETAKNLGRLTMNPIKHLDPIGTVCLILFGMGWAKPVPIDSRNFKHPKLGMAITALMGPVANIVAGFVGLLIYNALFCFAKDFMATNVVGGFLEVFLSFYILVNVNLAVFNLLPIPPLDGSKILFAFLPDRAVEFCYRYQMFFFLGLFALISFGPLRGILSYLSSALLQGMSWLAMLPFKSFI